MTLTVLETERLLFRPHLPEDLEPFCAMEADPDVRRWVGGAPRTREEARAKFRGFTRPVKHRMRLWATVYKPEGLYVGRCGIYPNFALGPRQRSEGVLAFYLARAYWGRGLATEAGRALVRFGFEELALPRIVASVEVGNDASAHVLGKLGFSFVRLEEGERRSFRNYELRREG